VTGNTSSTGLEVVQRRPTTDQGCPHFSSSTASATAPGAENWQEAAADAVSLRGHGGAAGSRARRGSGSTDDVIAAVAALPAPPVLVGHSMGGLVVQQVLARYAVQAAVPVAPIPAHPAVSSLTAVARRPAGRDAHLADEGDRYSLTGPRCAARNSSVPGQPPVSVIPPP